LDAHGWDGGWYRRAYDDSGQPLGSQSNSECRIDALAQSWAVISQAAPADKAKQAMAALKQHLIDKEAGIIRLLTPAFVDDPRDPGYIKGYVAGVRENGGQYSHAACWVVQATALLGHHEEAWALLKMLSPINHSSSPERLTIYKGEPYVLAADVYGATPHLGRAGWTWYTGAAGWFYRIAIETLLGFRIQEGRHLILAPRIPRHWPGFGLDYGLPAGGRLRIRVENPDHKAGPIRRASLDDHALSWAGDALEMALPEDGRDHELLAWL
jgi:cyclic beta-1,2-glucan synthetase